MAEKALWTSLNPDYIFKPAETFTEFVASRYYLGLDAYKEVLKIGDEIVKGDYTEAVIVGGIGSGKSFLAQCLSLFWAHKILCLKEPHKFYNILNDKPIAIINMGLNASQAKNVVFAGIRSGVRNSWFFKLQNPEVLETQIKFGDKLMLISGNSKETTPLGLNIILASLDEAAWYLDTEERNLAEDIYTALRRRIISRFGNDGLIMMDSSPRYVDDFIMKKYEQSRKMKRIYGIVRSTWEMKDRGTMNKKTFEFVVAKDNKGEPVETWDIPVDFQEDFEMNPEKSMRDYGARPSLVIQAFDRDSAVIIRNIDKSRAIPLDERGQFRNFFKRPDRTKIYYLHIDLGLKKDACGLAMGHLESYTRGERKKKVKVDLMMRIKPNETGGEIKFSTIRDLIYTIKRFGYNIGKVTFDGWQSVDSIQILQSKGISAEVLSVDKDITAYETMKELMHEKRLNYYNFKPFISEYQRLELIKGKKVDHPRGGSKDVTDAVAGVCKTIVLEGLEGDEEIETSEKGSFERAYQSDKFQKEWL